jgi:hypothetical protein
MVLVRLTKQIEQYEGNYATLVSPQFLFPIEITCINLFSHASLSHLFELSFKRQAEKMLMSLKFRPPRHV